MRIVNGRVICCGEDLGKLKKDEVYYCKKCFSLIFLDNPEQKKITVWAL